MALELRTGRYGNYWGDSFDSSHYLDSEKQKINAIYLYNALSSQGWTINAIAGLLGNLQTESSVNPGRWQSDIVQPSDPTYAGYGLVQWTPYTKYTNWANNQGLNPSDFDTNISRIIYEVDNSIQWGYDVYGTPPPYNFKGFTESTKTPYDLAIEFLRFYERPAEYNQPQRGIQATEWYNYLQSISFVPRFTDEGIVNNYHWYSDNIFYQSGYGMPNCTCYAWGRFWEIGDPNNTKENKPVNLPTGDGGTWFNSAVSRGFYETGQTPKLGSVICFSDNTGGSGHVAIVEEIKENGTIICSNSAYNGTFFFLSTIEKINNTYNWSHYTCQGFIYNPFANTPTPPTPPTPTQFTKSKFKLPFYYKIRRK